MNINLIVARDNTWQVFLHVNKTTSCDGHVPNHILRRYFSLCLLFAKSDAL